MYGQCEICGTEIGPDGCDYCNLKLRQIEARKVTRGTAVEPLKIFSEGWDAGFPGMGIECPVCHAEAGVWCEVLVPTGRRVVALHEKRMGTDKDAILQTVIT